MRDRPDALEGPSRARSTCRSPRALVAASIAIASVLAPSAPGIAQTAPASSSGAPSAQDAKVAAQALFEEAMVDRKKNDFARACAKLGESLRLDPAPGTKFYLAECMEQTGKLATAWLLYTEVADAMAATGQEKREAFARERSTALAQKLARIQINVPAGARASGLVVKRDGVALGEAQWGFATPVELGAHTIEATAPNAQPFKKIVEATKLGETITVEIPSPASASRSGSGAGAEPPLKNATPIPPSFFDGTLHKAGAALGGVGFLGIAAGSLLGAIAIDKQLASNKGPCDLVRDVCTREGLALRADAIAAATGSTIAFIAGGALLTTGIVLLVLPSTRLPETAIVAHPEGLTLEGRW